MIATQGQDSLLTCIKMKLLLKRLLREYFDEINAPYKKLYLMEDTTHGLLESKSEAFSEIVHEIYSTERGTP